MLSASQSVAQVVSNHSECAEVFQRHRIDFCCRGDLSIETAASQRGVDLSRLMGELGQAITLRGEAAPRAKELTTAALIDHIVHKHHAYLRKALPFLRPLAAKVARVHGDHNPKLRLLDEAVAELAETLLTHLDEEEQSLFPALRASTGDDAAALAPSLEAMRDEHLGVAALLERIRAATDDFTLPDWACNSYRALFAELLALEADVFTHVHLENHVLAPRFVAAPSPAETPLGSRFELLAEAAALRDAPEWREFGQSAKTLLRTDDTRVVLIALRKGARMLEHKTGHSITILTLEGRVELGTPAQNVALTPLELLFLEAGVPHDVVAREDSTVLLTINWRHPAA